MTFNNAPWAVDGARTTAALARLATYATGGGRSGVVKPTDLKVLPLSVPGNGLRITSGGAVINNGYLNIPDEAYAVSNPSTHTVLAADMPSPVPAVAYSLVCVVVGDPEFIQTGHPFMPSDIPPEDAADFEYVRVVMVPCTASTTEFEQLGLDYPAYALARLEIPANTSTITSGMIVDLRKLAQARSQRELLAGLPASNAWLSDPNVNTTDWISYKPYVEVPPWATSATVVITLAAIVVFGAPTGELRARLGSNVGPTVGFDASEGSTAQRVTYVVTGTFDVTAQQGQTLQLFLEAKKISLGGPGERLDTWTGTQVIYDVQFSERAV